VLEEVSAGVPQGEPIPGTGANSVLSNQALVLNQNYEPLNVTSVHRAARLVLARKAEVLEHNGHVLHSYSMTMPAPSVVRLCYQVRRPLPELKLTRKSVFARDGHRCQYCGRADAALTLDHVVPRARAGRTDWDNVVTCCLRCNNQKGNRTPREAGMHLVRLPKQPRLIPYVTLHAFLCAYRASRWQDYLEPWMGSPAAEMADALAERAATRAV
jgi:5-methylcytosine-specific restriction endonuclease McrA